MKRRMVGIVAFVLCFGLVACSAEESGSGSGSSLEKESSAAVVESSVGVEVEEAEPEEPEAVVTEDAETEEKMEADVETGGTEVAEATEELEVAVDEAYSGEKVEEYKLYAIEMTDYMGLCMYSMMAMELMSDYAGENPVMLEGVAQMMGEVTTEIEGFQSVAVPEDLKWQHKALADSLGGIMAEITDMLYVMTDLLYLIQGYETKSESELLAMVPEILAMELEIEEMSLQMEDKVDTMTEVGGEISVVLMEVLGTSYIDELVEAMEATVEGEYAELLEMMG